MEPITLCGAIIVAFGLWVEFEPKLRAIAKAICNSKFSTEMISKATVQSPAYMAITPKMSYQRRNFGDQRGRERYWSEQYNNRLYSR